MAARRDDDLEVDLDAAPGESRGDGPGGPSGGPSRGAARGPAPRTLRRWRRGGVAVALLGALAAGVSAHASSAPQAPAAQAPTAQDRSSQLPSRSQYEALTDAQVQAIDLDAQRRVTQDPRLDDAASEHWACLSTATTSGQAPETSAGCEARWTAAQQRLLVQARAAARAAWEASAQRDAEAAATAAAEADGKAPADGGAPLASPSG